LVGNRIHRIARNIVVTILVGIALFATRNASAAQLTLDWVDNAGGTASFTIERKTDITGTYERIATTPTGTTSYVDTAVVAGSTYCYRVKASNGSQDSGFSNDACASPTAGVDFIVARAGTGGGTVVSSPPGITCGGNCAASYPAGKVITLTATADSGSFFSGWSGGGCSGTAECVIAGNTPMTVTATFTPNNTAPTAGSASLATETSSNVATSTQTGVTTSSGPITPAPALTLAFAGTIRDRVGQGNTAVGPDGALDGAFFFTLAPGAGPRTLTQLELRHAGPTGIWDTDPLSPYWVLGVAASLDGPLLNTADGAVSLTLPEGSGAMLFAADLVDLFVLGSAFTLTATFADGTTTSASTTIGTPPALSLAFIGTVRDRVGQDNTALGPDGALDGTFFLTLAPGAGPRTVTRLELQRTGPIGIWDTDLLSPFWALGVAGSLDGPLLNAADGALSFTLPESGAAILFAANLGDLFVPGSVFTVTATFADGTSGWASVTVPALQQ